MPGMLPPMGSQRVRHNWATKQQQQTSSNITSTPYHSEGIDLFRYFSLDIYNYRQYRII